MDEVIRLIDQLWFKTKEYSDDFNRPEAQQLHRFVRRILDDARAHKTPESLLFNVQALERMLQDLEGNEGIYSPDHVDDMRDRCIDLENKLRQVAKQS